MVQADVLGDDGMRLDYAIRNEQENSKHWILYTFNSSQTGVLNEILYPVLNSFPHHLIPCVLESHRFQAIKAFASTLHINSSQVDYSLAWNIAISQTPASTFW